MLITTKPQQTLWETILPPGYQDLPKQLAAVDALLDDPVFFQPYRALLCGDRSTVDPDRDLPADDVPQAPLPVGLRDAVPGGQGLAVLVAVLPGPAGLQGSAPVDLGKDHHPVRAGDDRQAERGVAGRPPRRRWCPVGSSYKAAPQRGPDPAQPIRRTGVCRCSSSPRSRPMACSRPSSRLTTTGVPASIDIPPPPLVDLSCEKHRIVVEDAHPITDAEHAELQHRRETDALALARTPHERPKPLRAMG